MMKRATVVVSFYDLLEEVLRNPGDIFQADDERAEQLEKLGFVTLEESKPVRKKVAKK